MAESAQEREARLIREQADSAFADDTVLPLGQMARDMGERARIRDQALSAFEEPLTVQRAIAGARIPMIIGGSVAGGLGGAGGGPVTMAAGSSLGAGAGSALNTAMVEIAREMGYETALPPPTFKEFVDETVQEIALDLVATGVVSAAMKAGSLGRELFRKIVGGKSLTAEEMRIVEQARAMGVDLGLINFRSDSTVSQLFVNGLAKFPLVGSRLKSRIRAQGEAAQRQMDTWLAMGPTRDMAAMGIDLLRLATVPFRGMTRGFNQQWTSLIARADQAAATVSRAPIERALDDAISEGLRRGNGELIERGGVLPQTFMGTQFAPIGHNQPGGINIADAGIRWKDPTLGAIFEDLGIFRVIPSQSGRSFTLHVTIPERMSLSQLDNLLQRASANLDIDTPGFGQRVFGELKRAVDNAQQTLDNPELLREMNELRSSHATAMMQIEAPQMKKARAVDTNIGGVTPRPGTAHPDEAFRLLYDFKSPQGIRELRRLVGPDAMAESFRIHMDDLWKRALFQGEQDVAQAGFRSKGTGGGVNIRFMEEQLGLYNKNSIEYATLQEALRGTGITVKQVEDFVDIVGRIKKAAPSDFSAMVGRRAQLGGIRGMVGAIIPSAAIGGGLFSGPAALGAAMLWTVGQAGGHIMTNPRFLRQMEAAADPARTLLQRKTIFLAVLDGLEKSGFNFSGQGVLDAGGNVLNAVGNLPGLQLSEASQ